MMFGFNNKRKGYGFGPMPGFSNQRRSTIARGNWDRDSKPNRTDCEPFNFRKQDYIVRHIDEDEEEAEENKKRKFKTKKEAINEMSMRSGYFMEEIK